MLSAELQFGGFDGARWGNLLSLFSPAETVGEDLLLVVDEQDVVLGALLRGAGRYPALLGQTLPPSLPTLCAQLGVRRALVLRDGAMEELAERMGAAIDTTDDYVTQLLTTLRVARELVAEDRILVWPDPLGAIPLPSPRAVRPGRAGSRGR